MPIVKTVANLGAVALLELLAGCHIQLAPILRDAPRGTDTEGARHGDADEAVVGPSENGAERDAAGGEPLVAPRRGEHFSSQPTTRRAWRVAYVGVASVINQFIILYTTHISTRFFY